MARRSSRPIAITLLHVSYIHLLLPNIHLLRVVDRHLLPVAPQIPQRPQGAHVQPIEAIDHLGHLLLGGERCGLRLY